MGMPLPDVDTDSWLDHQRKQVQEEIDKRIGGFSLQRAIGDRIAGLQSLVGGAPVEPEPAPAPSPEPAPVPAFEEPVPEPLPAPAFEPEAAPAEVPAPARQPVVSARPRPAPSVAPAASTPAPQPAAGAPSLDDWRRQTFAAGLNAIEQAGGNVQTFANQFGQRFSDDTRSAYAAALNAADQAGADVQSFASLFSMPEPPRPAERLPTQPGGAAAGAPAGGVNPNPTPDEVRAYITQAAQQRGIDPNIALRVANSEGGFEAARRGTFKTGSSWWPFQLHYGGKGYEHLGTTAGMGNSFTAETGYEPGDPNAWQAATDYALDRAKSGGWGAWYGAKAQGITGFAGIDRSAPDQPFHHRVGEQIAGAARPFIEGARAAYAFPVEGYKGKVDLHWGKDHGGSDIFAPKGTPVVAMRGGRVTSAGSNAIGGNYVTIQGDDGNQYYYAHLDQTPAVKAGQTVQPGAYLGGVGDTGNARGTGAHLHLGIGPEIVSGTGPTGGTGGGFDAVGLLRSVLEGEPVQQVTASVQGAGQNAWDTVQSRLEDATSAARAAQARIQAGFEEVETSRAQLGRDIESRMADLRSMVERTGQANVEATGRAAERTGVTSALGGLWENVQPPEGGRFGVGESGVGQWWRENSLLNQLERQQQINDRYNIMGTDPDTGRYRIDASAFDRMSPEDRRVWNEASLAVGTSIEPTRIAGGLGRLAGPAGEAVEAAIRPDALLNRLRGVAEETPATAATFARGVAGDIEAQRLEDLQRSPVERAIRAPLELGTTGATGVPQAGRAVATGLEQVGVPSPYREIAGGAIDVALPGGAELAGPARGLSRLATGLAPELGESVARRLGPEVAALADNIPGATQVLGELVRAPGAQAARLFDDLSALVERTNPSLRPMVDTAVAAYQRGDFARAAPEQLAAPEGFPNLLAARAGGAAGAQAATTLGGAAAGGAAGAATTPEGASIEERLVRIAGGAAAGAAGGTALGRVLDRPATAAAAAPAGVTPTPLSDEATRLLNMVAQGGVPGFMTDSLRRIAREHDIDITPDTTPNAVVEALKLRRDTAAGAGPRPTGGAAAAPPPPSSPRAGPAAARRAYPAAAQAVPGQPVREMPQAEQPPGARPIELSTEDEIARLRLDDFPEDLQEDILNAASATDWARTQRRGVIPDEVAEEMAERYAADTTLDEMIKRGSAGRTYNTEQLRAVRNATAAQAMKVNELTEVIQAGDDSSKTLQQLWHEADKLQRLVQIGEGARAEWGRAGRAFQTGTRLIDLAPNDAIREITKLVGGDRNELVKRVAEYSTLVKSGVGPVELANFWAGMKDPASVSDWVRLIRYNSMLSGPRSFEINFISNMVEMPWRLARDVAASTARGRPGEVMPELQGAAAGFHVGVRAFVDTLFKGITPEAAARGEIPRSLSARLRPGSGAQRIATVLEFPSRLMQAADEWAMAISYNAQLGREAAITASREGLRGDAWSARVSGIMEKPNAHPDIMQRASAVAERMTWKGEMGNLGTGLERFTQKTGLLGNLVLPFLRTPYHLATRGIERSPLGLAGLGLDIARGKYGKPSQWGEALAGRNVPEGVTPMGERLWDGLVGTAIFAGLYQQAMSKNISAAGPSDRNDRELLMSQGWQPYSVRIGDQWISYANWGPVAIPLGLAAAASEAQYYARPGDQGHEILLDGARRTAQIVTEQTYLQAIGSVWKGMTQPDIYGATMVQNYITSYLPFGSAVNTVAQATDPLARKQDRTDWLDFIQYRLPPGTPLVGGRSEVSARQDVLGRPMENQYYGARAFLPIRATSAKQDAVLQELDTHGVSIPAPPTTLTRNGIPFEVTPEEGRQLQTRAGEELTKFLSEEIKSKNYESMDEPTRVRFLQNAVDKLRTSVHNEWLGSLSKEEFERRRLKGEQRREIVPVSGR